MNLENISKKVSEAGRGMVVKNVNEMKTVSINELGVLSRKDKFVDVIRKALDDNRDGEVPLYLHQYEALYALAKGYDVLLCTPCGSGKTRVLENAPLVAKLGFDLGT